MHLSSAPYPASKGMLQRYAEAHRAASILPVLARLPEREYSSALDVVKAVVGLGGGGRVALTAARRPRRPARASTGPVGDMSTRGGAGAGG